MKVLFVARRFPPSVGGMQKFAFDLAEALPGQGIELIKVTWGGSSRLSLPLVLPWLFLRGLWALVTDRSIQVIHMQDAVLSPLGWLLSKLSRRPWVVVAHGLDLTFKLAFYQKVNLYFARRADKVIAISQATAEEARQRGISPKKITVIPLGVDDSPLAKVDRQKVRFLKGIKKGDPVLLTVGRLAKRKGVAWFIQEVLPGLDERIHYVVIGGGDEQGNIEKAVQEHKLESRVHLLGQVDDTTKTDWLRSADIFVMPNIEVPGDMEGFGIVAQEAVLAELPVVASNLEGISQALQDKKNGFLLTAEDLKAYHDKIQSLMGNDKTRKDFGRQARLYTITKFGWPSIARQYRHIYQELIS